MASILVVDTQESDRAAVAAELRELGHQVSESTTAATAIRVIDQQRTDLMLLEWSLPDSEGLNLLSNIKHGERASVTRVVMFSDSGQSQDVVAALDSGADDFLGKPYAMPELLARVGACLRRPPTACADAEITAGGIRVDDVAHRVLVDGEALTLAPREYRLLAFLMANRDRVYSRSQLLTHVWGRNAGVGVRTVDVHIRRLRSLLEPYRYDHFVQTVRGSGYRFSADV